MTKKIFKSIFIVATAVLLATLVLIIGILYTHFSTIEENQLKTNLTFIQQGLEDEGITYLKNFKNTNTRITWIDENGTVLYDTENDAKTMDNHKNREEVNEAFETGYGESHRYSATLTEKNLYYAKLLKDDTVLRISKSQDSVVALVYGMIQPILFILVLALIFSAVIAAKISRRIVEPLNNIALDNPLDNQVYDELSPLLRTIERQHKQIDRQLNELQKSRNEFEFVTENMNEGLVLLGKDEKIISINNSAQEFFEITDYCVGSDFIMIERSLEVDRILKEAFETGNSEIQLERSGRVYQLNVTRVENDGQCAGLVILIFDITDQVFAERNRREFTANVTHELKTPLQSIMGSAELIQNGIVKEKDMPVFIGRIRSEAARLVALIEDIIHLSQLDEHIDLKSEDVELYSMASEEIEALRSIAAEKDIDISLQGDEVNVNAVPHLVHEVIYNLCDNAIKYNTEGGSINVTVGKAVDRGWILVEDTGIGIPPEHQERIFERFYRIDKSHSKETGGTGLGLSIVKHAMEYMKGSIEVKSVEGEGSAIKVFLPLSKKQSL